jgi:hypothetical protein
LPFLSFFSFFPVTTAPSATPTSAPPTRCRCRPLPCLGSFLDHCLTLPFFVQRSRALHPVLPPVLDLALPWSSRRRCDRDTLGAQNGRNVFNIISLKEESIHFEPFLVCCCCR